MFRRWIVLVAALAIVIVTGPAGATCKTGRIGYDRQTGRVVVELPECHPYE